MSLFPPVKATKPHLPGEQPLTGGRWDPQKKIPMSRTKRKSHRDGRKGTIMIKLKPQPTDPRAGLSQAATEGGQPHPSADNWIKVLLSKALPTRARLSFSHHQSLPSGSLHKPPSLFHQMADRRTTIPQWLKQKLHFGKTMGKMQEMFTKELKDQTKMNNTLEGINSRITEAEEWINDLEDKMVEITAAEETIEKKNGI